MTSRFRAFFVAVGCVLGGLIASTALAGSSGAPVTLGDFNADQRIDVLVADAGVLYVYATADGGTTVNESESATLALLPGGVTTTVQAVADFNGDGRADVLTQTDSDALYIFISAETVAGSPIASDSAASGSPIGVPAGFSVAGAGDANGDGRADIYVVDDTTGFLYTYIIDEGGITVDDSLSGSPVTIPSGWSIQSIGDYNGDGRSDVLVENDTLGTLYTWTTNPDGISFAEFPASNSPFGLPAGWSWGGGGKFVGAKTSSDLAIQEIGDGLVYIVVTNDNGVTADNAASTLNVGGIAGFTVAGIGDFSGDGIADTLVQNASGLLFVFINSDPSTQTAEGLLTTVPAPFDIAAGKVGF